MDHAVQKAEGGLTVAVVLLFRHTKMIVVLYARMLRHVVPMFQMQNPVVPESDILKDVLFQTIIRNVIKTILSVPSVVQ